MKHADAALQLRRLLHVIPRLADGESHPIAEVARLAGTDRDTVLADLHSLSARFDHPGGFVPGLAVIMDAEHVRLRADHFARPMRLTAPELCALELGLAMLRAERPPSEHRAIDGARARLRRALAKLPADEIRGDGRWGDLGTHGDPEHLAVLRAGVRDRRRVHLVYRGADATAPSARTICPYRLVAARGAWYIVARCEDTGDGDALRIFRLDRVEAATLTGDPFTVPEDFSLDGIMRQGSVFRASEPEALRVRYSPRVARWIAEREGRTADAEGSITVEHPLADERWAVRHVLQYGPDAEVLAPASVRRAVAERLRAILDA